MEKYPIRQNDLSAGERITLAEFYRKRKRFFAMFLICAALLVAAFAVSLIFESGIAMQAGNGTDATCVGGTPMTEESRPEVTEGTNADEGSQGEESTDAPNDPVGSPVVGTPVLTVQLPNGNYINNESIHTTDPLGYLDWEISCAVGTEPLVLVLHTHTSEGYLSAEQSYIAGDLGVVTYTEDASRSVLAAGTELCTTLNKAGIPTIHCTTVHDGDGRLGAYERAAETVRFFLSHYPSIMLVIDLHRDAILTSEGEYVRAVTETEDGAMAQVMAVVGSDGNGTHHPNWERNLALAECLRAALNKEVSGLCRPSILRNASYNQELAPYSLLLEIGTGANSVEEAKRSASLVGKVLSDLLYQK